MYKKTIGVILAILFTTTAILPVDINAEKKVTGTSYDMVVIGPSSFASYLQPLIDHKNDRGLDTVFVSLDEIYDGTYFSVQGRDDQEKIKYFIKNSIENWDVVYVLLVGDADQVPIRYSYTNDNYSLHPEPTFISDLYYADIYDSYANFSSWDKNDNDKFAEWTGGFAEDGPIDLKPDVCLGRLACIDTSDVQIVVRKIIDYESKAAADSWFKRMVVAGGDTYSKFPGFEGENYTQIALNAMEGFTPVKLWASNGKLTKKPWSIIREINKGCGFIYLSGHGSPTIWATYSPDETIGNFGLFNMLFLFNKNKLPICLVDGCQNSKFDVSSGNNFWWIFFPWMKPCWSWELVSSPRGGSIATIGSTGLCWYSAEYDGAGSNWLSVQFFEEYAKGEKVIGKIWNNCIAGFLEENPINWNESSGSGSCIDAKTVQEWVLLGDPSLVIGGAV